MIYKIIFVLLAPLVALQGRYVRRVAIKLSEPTGERSGKDGQGTALRLLIVGDSAAAGVGVTTQKHALLGNLVSQLSNHYELTWQLIAKSGKHSGQCHDRLHRQPNCEVDVVVVSLGVNDVLSNINTKQWLVRQRRLITLLKDQFGAKKIILTKIPPMERFSLLPQPLRWLLGQRCKEFNLALAKEIAKDPMLIHLDLSAITTNELASDGFHPNQTLYRYWAQAVASQININFKPD